MSTVQKSTPTVAHTEDGRPASFPGQPFLFSAEAFRKMIDADVFADDDRVELWDGWIITKMANKVPHSNASMFLSYKLNQILPEGWLLTGENPINLGPNQTPLPDHFVLRGTPRNYSGRYPDPAEVGLVVEIAETSLRRDTTVKLAGYAAAGIPTYWVINLIKNVIQTYETPIPAEGRYESMQTYAVGQAVPLRLSGVLIAEIPASDLLPARS